MFYNYAEIGFNNLCFFLVVLFFLGIYGYTSLMDRKNLCSMGIEVFRGVSRIWLLILYDRGLVWFEFLFAIGRLFDGALLYPNHHIWR